MGTLIQLSINLGLCLAGMLAYGLVATRRHMHDFKWRVFVMHNKTFWVWSTIAQTLFAVLMVFYPPLEIWVARKLITMLEAITIPDLGIPEDLIKTIVYLTLAWQLSRFTNVSVKKSNKIGEEKHS